MTDHRDWPAPARAMALAASAAVAAARAGDADAFDAALVGLRRQDRAQLSTLLGGVTCALLERAHRDGLDSEAAEQVLQATLRVTVGWYRPLDSDALIRALLGALGVGESDDLPPVDPDAVLAHGVLLVAAQLEATGTSLEPLLEDALRELRRAQTLDGP